MNIMDGDARKLYHRSGIVVNSWENLIAHITEFSLVFYLIVNFIFPQIPFGIQSYKINVDRSSDHLIVDKFEEEWLNLCYC